MKQIIVFFILSIIFSACSGNGELSDAYGNFEATEIIISSEVPGKVVLFDLENGDYLEKGKTVVEIDTVNFYLKGKVKGMLLH